MSAELCDLQHKGRELLPYADAVRVLAEKVAPNRSATEAVELVRAAGRVLAAPVALDRDEPPVPRSAMDGFALRSSDGEQPRRKRGTIFAGTGEVNALEAGEAAAVMTGGTVPPGADAVIPVELTRTEDGSAMVQVLEAPKAGAHVRRAGEMGAKGRELLTVGHRLSVEDLTAAAGCGADPLQVFCKPKACVLSTGDEVVAWTRSPEAHQVRDSNRLGVALQLERAGAEVVHTRRVADEAEALEAAMAAALEECALIVTIGGVSMGQKDLMPTVFERLDVTEWFHGVSVQPGKPVWLGARGGAHVLGLPGNPVSSYVILELFGVPLVRRLAGIDTVLPRPLELGIAGGAARTRARERFVPARWCPAQDGRPRVTPTPSHGSGDWTSLATANALLHLPAFGEVQAGDEVHFLRLD